MRGSIRRRGKASWELTVELGVDPMTRKRKRRFVSVKGTRRDAERELTAVARAIDTGIAVDPSRETVGEYLRRWLRDYAQANVAPRTFDRYRSIVEEHLIPALGSVRLSALRPPHIVDAERRWLAGGRKRGRGGLSPRTVLHHHRLLHEALRHAVRWQLLSVNPCAAVTPPRAMRKEMNSLDAEQAQALLSAARGTRFDVQVTAALYSGLRLGELLGLRWRDLDLDAGRLSVQQTLQPVRGGGVVFGPTKTHRSRRSVSIPAVVVERLREHRRLQVEARLIAGDAWEDSDLVFTDALGRPQPPGPLREGFYKLLAAAGLPPIRLHDLRHTMATLMLAAGEHPKVVSERLGHSTVNLTLDTYSHVLPGLQQAAAERLAETLRGTG